MESWGTFPLGRLFEIPIRLHVLFLVTLVLAVIIQAVGDGYAMLLATVVFGPVLLFTVLIHELGHCLAARKIGAEVHGILLWPLGGLAFIGHSGTPARDIFVAVSGPLTHIPMFVVWFAVLGIASHIIYHGAWAVSLTIPDPRYHFGLALCAAAAQLNLWLMAFNLCLPAYPLDGGRIFADLLLLCRVPVRTAAIITVAVAVAIAAGLVAWGIVRVAVLTLAVGLWMLFTTIQLGMAIHNGTVAQHPMFCYESAPGGFSGGVQHSSAPEVMLPANQPRSAQV